ncbi:MAG: carbohydrate-binding protein [Clostridia bacterium]|nr:carbohydrate-binding protein [Clostridia bacterium]
MKKYATLLLAVVMVFSLAISASASSGLYEEMPESYIVLPIEDAELIDDDTTQDLGGNGTFISIVDGYGCGNSSLNDCVVFHDIDFGENGADQINVLFGFGKDEGSETTLSIALDDEENLIGEFSIGYTGGWDIDNALWASTPVTIPSGVHTIYLRFTNENSGSFSQVSFAEADPAPVVEDVVEEPVAETPETADAGIIVSVAVMAVAAGIVLNKRK